jgi:hypothetical protein
MSLLLRFISNNFYNKKYCSIPMINPPTAPMPIIGAYTLVIMAEGILRPSPIITPVTIGFIFKPTMGKIIHKFFF